VGVAVPTGGPELPAALRRWQAARRAGSAR
jgi:hypothetical protein